MIRIEILARVTLPGGEVIEESSNLSVANSVWRNPGLLAYWLMAPVGDVGRRLLKRAYKLMSPRLKKKFDAVHRRS